MLKLASTGNNGANRGLHQQIHGMDRLQGCAAGLGDGDEDQAYRDRGVADGAEAATRSAGRARGVPPPIVVRGHKF